MAVKCETPKVAKYAPVPVTATSPPRRGADDEHGDDDGERAKRQALCDGLPEIGTDSSVSQLARNLIAAVRTLILWLMLGGMLASLYVFRDAVWSEQVDTSRSPLVLDLCVASGSGGGLPGPALSSSDPARLGFLDLIGQPQRKVLTFEPVGRRAAELKLPKLQYYVSEEYKAGGSRRSVGYSFGLFAINELRFEVSVRGGRNASCPQARAAGGWEEKEEEEWAVPLLGQAVYDALVSVGRRKPRSWLMTTPRFHGSLLLRTDNDRMWSKSEGTFGARYSPSTGWKIYQFITIGLRALGSIAVFLLLARFSAREWERAVEVWVAQYDYLWAEPSFRASAHGRGRPNAEAIRAEAKAEAEAEAARRSSSVGAFSQRIQACSTFFVLDHVLGDAQRNAESWALGVASSLVHGSILVLFAVLPVSQAFYFAEWKPLCFFLVGLHCACAMGFGATYYCGVHYSKRWVLLYVHLGCSFSCVTYSIAYLFSAVLFILTRMFVMPEEALVWSVSVATIAVYVVVVSHKLQQIREGIIGQLHGKESRGAIIGFLCHLGLDVRTIVCTVAGGAFFILLVAIMIMLAGEMYFTASPLPASATACFTSVTTFAATVQQLKTKEKQSEKALGGLGSLVLGVV